MFDFTDAPVPVRSDIGEIYAKFWRHLAGPGATMTGRQRVSLAEYARTGTEPPGDLPSELTALSRHLMADPGTVTETEVRASADAAGDPATVETISIVSQLSAVDDFHRALGLPAPTLPAPREGMPTGDVMEGLKRRRTHIPVPPGPIPVTLDLVPAEGRMFNATHGPQYMTGEEMAENDFRRDPGLNRAQMELISSRLSFHNECFY